ncbi:MAG: 3-phosphoshikimate 1-carboxyvinyltransferase [Clostridia bacterium]|nr:3-phosphoshikimate 1-carboxyvinyltransferase [Clostridia bacterium]
MNVRIIPGRACGTLCAPPSKSAAHRLLICGALAGNSTIGGLELSEDILATLDCLSALGYEFDLDGSTVSFTGKTAGHGDLYCRESGSTLRFMIPIALLENEAKTLRGSSRLFERPLTVYEDIFEKDGIKYERGDGFIAVDGALKSGDYSLPANVSSQFITGLLFVLPLLDGDSKITLTGELQSLSYVDLTIEALAAFGVIIEREGDRVLKIKGGSKYEPRDLTVEGDWSNAAFFEALNSLGSTVEVTGLRQNSLQGDRVCIDLFSRLCEDTPVISIADCPDLAPIMMTVAAAKSGAVFTDTKRLKIKESDRGNVMAQELKKFGADVEVEENRIIVKKTPLHAPKEIIESHNDHRVAMSISILGTLYGCEIAGAECVKKSLPSFYDLLSSLNIEVQKYEA